MKYARSTRIFSGAQSYTNSDSSIYNRATNIMMTYVSWLFPRRISSGTQRCMDVKWGKAAPNLDVSNLHEVALK